VSKIQDQDYLLNEQYKTPNNLNARINLHVKYSTNTYGWFPWIFDHYTFPTQARILELGCGPGDIWLDNIDRIPASWTITLSDFSPGMIEKAQLRLANQPHPFNFEIIDAQSIPYDDDHFDVVIANHCIYHFPDRSKAFSEIRRVLRPGGSFCATTIGATHMLGLTELAEQFDSTIEAAFDNESITFNLENGGDQLREWFTEVEMHRYLDDLNITEAESLVDYVLSGVRIPLKRSRRAEFLSFVENELATNNGVIKIHKDSGLFIAR
jgi:ubiquinone/menaquinone biosynthesis C-methylase UbiE